MQIVVNPLAECSKKMMKLMVSSKPHSASTSPPEAKDPVGAMCIAQGKGAELPNDMEVT